MSIDKTAHGFEAQIIADLRRTHAQLRRGVDAAATKETAAAWSMRLTVEEVDVLLAIVDERDDLKRRLLSDWEPDIELDTARQEIADATGYQIRDGHAWAPCITEPITNLPATREQVEALRRGEAVTFSCPRRDTVHDCPLGGCADATPREAEIPDLPLDHRGYLGQHDEGCEPCRVFLEHGDPNLGREARETPPITAYACDACGAITWEWDRFGHAHGSRYDGRPCRGYFTTPRRDPKPIA